LGGKRRNIRALDRNPPPLRRYAVWCTIQDEEEEEEDEEEEQPQKKIKTKVPKELTAATPTSLRTMKKLAAEQV
jgi:hypothetical protein